jgi:hypothetical protein
MNLEQAKALGKKDFQKSAAKLKFETRNFIDGKLLYVPQLEGPSWHVVDAANGNVISTIETKSGSHNTIYSADGAPFAGYRRGQEL